MNDTTAPTRRTWSPNFARLAYAEGPRCNAKPKRTPSGCWTSCVKPAGHDGTHLADVMAQDLMPAEQYAEMWNRRQGL